MQYNWSNANRVTIKKIFSGLNQTKLQSGRQGVGGKCCGAGLCLCLARCVHTNIAVIYIEILKKKKKS